MKKILISGYQGDIYKNISSMTFPIMEKYAEKHGIDSLLCDLPNFNRAASWSKIKMMIYMLNKYDLVLWLDSDIVILEDNEDITKVSEDKNIQYLAYHNINGDIHPNCGVWMVKKAMIPYLEKIWSMEEYINHYWWEQGALIEAIGMKRDEKNHKTYLDNDKNELYNLTGTLDIKWNYCKNDDRKIENPSFLHFAGTSNRLADISNLISDLKMKENKL